MSRGDGISYYAGEFLISPCGLELSMNWCGHDCSYCFANATSPNRRADVRSVMGLLANFRQRTTREARLLQAGIPVLVSNHVDPFAGTNAEQFEPIWEIAVSQGVQIAWQTRGAHKPQRRILDRVIKETPRSVWYVSIPMWDDAIRKRVEPRAPSIGSRLDLIAQLVEAGHVVTVGVNPLSLEWLPDYEPLLDHLKVAGVWGIWVQVPYFSKSFKAQIRPDQRTAMGEDFMAECGEFGSPHDVAHARQAMEYAVSIGLQVYSTSYEKPTQFFAPYKEVYGSVMPYRHQLVNVADAILQTDGPDVDGKDYLIVRLDDAMQTFHPLPLPIDYKKYLHHKNSTEFRRVTGALTGPLPSINPDQLWQILWNDEWFARSMGMLRFNQFAYASIRGNDVITPLLDADGNRLMVYRPTGWKYRYANTPELA